MNISLIVIRCQNIELSKDFYQNFGLSFVKEKHGDGPTHFSCEHDGCVFELYPNKGLPPNDNTRLGFKVADPNTVIDKMVVVNTYEFSGSKVFVVADPDGRKIEVSG